MNTSGAPGGIRHSPWRQAACVAEPYGVFARDRAVLEATLPLPAWALRPKSLKSRRQLQGVAEDCVNLVCGQRLGGTGVSLHASCSADIYRGSPESRCIPLPPSFASSSFVRQGRACPGHRHRADDAGLEKPAQGAPVSGSTRRDRAQCQAPCAQFSAPSSVRQVPCARLNAPGTAAPANARSRRG